MFIYKFEDGIFSSELTFSDGERQIVLDSRTSDAIGIAMRSKAPIYTTREIIDETGFIMEEHDITDDEASAEARQNSGAQTNDEPKIENYSIEELERTLDRLIREENYEEAAKVSEILKRKRGND